MTTFRPAVYVLTLSFVGITALGCAGPELEDDLRPSRSSRRELPAAKDEQGDEIPEGQADRSSRAPAPSGVGTESPKPGAPSPSGAGNPSVPETCAPPAGYTEQRIAWTSIFGTWPAYNGTRRLTVPPASYLSLEFTAGSSGTGHGTFDGTGLYPGGGMGAAKLSISETPGCFDGAKLPPNCVQEAAMYPGIGWTTSPSAHSCVLVPGRKYFINVTFGDASEPGPEPHCDQSPCGRDWANIAQ